MLRSIRSKTGITMDMIITFPGGYKVNAIYKGFTIETDQPREDGGDGTAPEPFSLFLASIGTCAGVYVLRFFHTRKIPTDGLQIKLKTEWDSEKRMLSKIILELHLPPHFPKKYISAVKSAVDACAVKRHILNPPEFITDVIIEEG